MCVINKKERETNEKSKLTKFVGEKIIDAVQNELKTIIQENNFVFDTPSMISIDSMCQTDDLTQTDNESNATDDTVKEMKDTGKKKKKRNKKKKNKKKGNVQNRAQNNEKNETDTQQRQKNKNHNSNKNRVNMYKVTSKMNNHGKMMIETIGNNIKKAHLTTK